MRCRDISADQHLWGLLVRCRYEALQLERIVGSSRAKKMLKGDSSTYMFC